jgi:hypothetical protein
VRTVAGVAEAYRPAFRYGLLVCAGVAVAAVLAALTVRDANAAPTMIRPRRRTAAGAAAEALSAEGAPTGTADL